MPFWTWEVNHYTKLECFRQFQLGYARTFLRRIRQEHMERNRADKDSKFRLILIESRIHRLARYYKSKGVLPPTWKYESATASTLVA